MPASLLCAAPRIPAITWEETANACAIFPAECGRWQPSPKYRRITFSCRGGSIRRISEMRFRSIGVTSFQNTWWIASATSIRSGAPKRLVHHSPTSTRPADGKAGTTLSLHCYAVKKGALGRNGAPTIISGARWSYRGAGQSIDTDHGCRSAS